MVVAQGTTPEGFAWVILKEGDLYTLFSARCTRIGTFHTLADALREINAEEPAL